MKRSEIKRKTPLRAKKPLARYTELKRGAWHREPSELWAALDAAGIEIDKGIEERHKHDEERAAAEWHRKYGSVERVLFVKHGGRCDVPDCYERLCETAHIETGGTGRKAHHSRTARLCRRHHQELHDTGRETFEAEHDMSLDICADDLERSWQEYGPQWIAMHYGDPDPGDPTWQRWGGDLRDRGYF